MMTNLSIYHCLCHLHMVERGSVGQDGGEGGVLGLQCQQGGKGGGGRAFLEAAMEAVEAVLYGG